MNRAFLQTLKLSKRRSCWLCNTLTLTSRRAHYSICHWYTHGKVELWLHGRWNTRCFCGIICEKTNFFNFQWMITTQFDENALILIQNLTLWCVFLWCNHLTFADPTLALQSPISSTTVRHVRWVQLWASEFLQPSGKTCVGDKRCKSSS
jgi:hypothetical protein